MTTIDLTDKQLELVRRAAMRVAVEDLKHTASEIARLETVAPWPAGVRSSDAQNAVTLVRESLDMLDVLSWPDDETRVEPEAA